MAFQTVTCDFATGLITGYNEAGYLGVQIDAYGGQDAGSAGVPAMHPYGFAGRPKDATAHGAGVHVLHFEQGSSEGFGLILHDPRVQERIPVLTPGSSVQYGDWGGFSQFDEETNTWTLYIPDGPSASAAHLIQVGEDANGKRVINVVHSSGLAIIMMSDADGSNGKMLLKNAVGDSYVQLDADGLTINGNVTISGSLTVGGPGGLPVLVGSTPGVPCTSLMAL